MAEIVGALILSAVGIESTLIPIVGTVSVTTATVVGSAAIIGAEIGLTYALQALSAKQNTNRTFIPLRQNIPPRQVVYGRTRASLSYTFYEGVSTTTDGSTDVLACHHGMIGNYVTFYLHEDEVFHYVIGVPDTENITPKSAELQDGRYTGKIWLNMRFGAPRELAYHIPSILFPSVYNATWRADGTATCMLFCDPTKKEDFGKIYPNGLPLLSVVIDGWIPWDPRDSAQDPDNWLTWRDYPFWDPTASYTAGDRILWDAGPRKLWPVWNSISSYSCGEAVFYLLGAYVSLIDSNVNHTPGPGVTTQWCPVGSVYIARVNMGPTVTTPDVTLDRWIAVGQNPVLQIIDRMLSPYHGEGFDRDVVVTPVLDDLMVQANYCDELVLTKSFDSRPRYTSSGSFTMDTPLSEVLGNILATCDGWMAENGAGAIALSVGKYVAPGVEDIITMDDIIDFAIELNLSDLQSVNQITIQYTSPPHKYKTPQGVAWRDEAAILARGRIRSQDLKIVWVDNFPQARNLSKIAINHITGAHGTVSVRLPYALSLLGKRWLRLKYSPLSVTQDCIIEVSPVDCDMTAGKFIFTYTIINPAVMYAWDPVTEEGDPPPIPVEFGTDVLTAPQNIEVDVNGDNTSGLYFTLSYDDISLPYSVIVRYRLVDDGTGNPGPWTETTTTTLTEVGGRIFSTTANVIIGYEYIVELAYVGSRGAVGAWSGPITTFALQGLIVDDLNQVVLDDLTGLPMTGDI